MNLIQTSENILEQKDINEWIEELKMEYPIKNFERLFLFMNLDDGWYNKRLIDTVEIRNFEKGKRASYKMQDQKIDNSIFEFYKYIRKLNLLERIMDFNHNECKIGLSKKIQEEGWFHINSKAFEEYLDRGLDNTYELIGKRRVCTAICQKNENDKKEFEETTENIEKILNSCLLSEYNHVIFDDTSASARVITAPKSDISQTECKLNVFPCGNVDTMWHGMKFKLVDSRQR